MKQAYRALDPAHPLDPSSPYYVARPSNPLDALTTELEFSDRPRQFLLAGHRGTGKTTELARIADRLRESRSVFTVELRSAGGPALLRDLCEALQSTKRGSSWSARVGTFIAAESTLELSLDSGHWLQELAKLLPNGPELPVLLIDGVDKLDPHEALAYLRPLRRVSELPLSTVCTVPLGLPLLDEFSELGERVDGWRFLPALPVYSRDGSVNRAGWELCQTVLERRAPVFEQDAADVLVGMSGGIHRELLKLSQKACVRAALDGSSRVLRDHASAAVQEAQSELRLRLRADDEALLWVIHETGQLTSDPEVLRLVQDQFVVAYAEAMSWFDVHPLIGAMVKKRPEQARG